MQRAKQQNAVLNEKFHVRKNCFRSLKDHIRCSTTRPLIAEADDMLIEELTINEFINGKAGFLGLVPAILEYLDALGCDVLTRGRLLPYLSLLQKRAAGDLPTNAQWIRNFIKSHPKQEVYTSSQVDVENRSSSGRSSAVSPEVIDDLLRMCDDIGMGRVQCPDLVGDVLIEPLSQPPPQQQQLPVSTSTASPRMQPPMNMTSTTAGDQPEEASSCLQPVASMCDGGDLVKPVHLDAALSCEYCRTG